METHVDFIDDAAARFHHQARQNTVSIAARRTSLAVGKLPPEVLGRVFLFCVPVPKFPRSDFSGPLIGSAQAPQLLTRISRRWRQVAFETPDLWTNLDLLNIGRGPVIPLATFLRYSASLPVDISLGVWPGNNTDEMLSAVQSLRACFHRIRSLHLSKATASLVQALFPLDTVAAMPLLEALSVYFPERMQRSRRDVGHIVAPRIHTVRVNDPTTLSILSLMRRVLGSVRAFHMDGSLYGETWLLPSIFPNVLAELSGLRTFSINFRGDLYLKFSQADAIILSELRTLHVTFSPSFAVESFLAALEVPSLETFQLRCTPMGMDDLPVHSRLVDFKWKWEARQWSWSLSALRRLDLEIWNHCENLANFLRRCSHLEELTIRHGWSGHEDVIAALAPQEGEHPSLWALPRLKRLSFYHCGFEGGSKLGDFAERRMGSSSQRDAVGEELVPALRLEIKGWSGLHSSTLERLVALAAEGAGLTFGCSNDDP